MKCPKCNYTSFDHHEACPKCQRDLAAAKEKMYFFSYVSSPPILIGIADLPDSRTVVRDSSMNDVMDETMTLDFAEGIEGQAGADSASSGEAADELSLDFDDFAFEDNDTLSPQPEAKVTKDKTEDADLDFSFTDEPDEITLSVDEPQVKTAPPAVSEEDKTLEGEIDFDFDLGLDEDEPSESTAKAKTSEEDITISPFDMDLSSDEEEKEDVTAELEKSVSALVGSIEATEEPSDQPKTFIPDLDTIDLDLDLDLDDMDNK